MRMHVVLGSFESLALRLCILLRSRGCASCYLQWSFAYSALALRLCVLLLRWYLGLAVALKLCFVALAVGPCAVLLGGEDAPCK